MPPYGAPPESHSDSREAQARVREYLKHVLFDINPKFPDPDDSARILHAAGEELLRLRLSDLGEATHEQSLSYVRRLTPALLRQARRHIEWSCDHGDRG